jgi:hypothetical protein
MEEGMLNFVGFRIVVFVLRWKERECRPGKSINIRATTSEGLT